MKLNIGNVKIKGFSFEIKIPEEIQSSISVNLAKTWEDPNFKNLIYSTNNVRDNNLKFKGIGLVLFNNSNNGQSLHPDNLLRCFINKNVNSKFDLPYFDLSICNGLLYFEDGSTKPIRSNSIRIYNSTSTNINSDEQKEIYLYPQPADNFLIISNSKIIQYVKFSFHAD